MLFGKTKCTNVACRCGLQDSGGRERIKAARRLGPASVLRYGGSSYSEERPWGGDFTAWRSSSSDCRSPWTAMSTAWRANWNCRRLVPMLFRHFYEWVRDLAGSVYGRRM